jgi:hypothetical protein
VIVIIHGPMASGKTFHSKAFAKHFGCSHIADWDRHGQPLPNSNSLLVLTNDHPRRAESAIRKRNPDAKIRIISIRIARLAIGVAPIAPPLPPRRAAR